MKLDEQASAAPRIGAALLTIHEAAARVNATVKQVRRRIKAGLLPAVRPPGARAYLVRAEDLDRLYAPVLAARKPKEHETETQKLDRLLGTMGLVDRTDEDE